MPWGRTGTEAALDIREGRISSVELVSACLERIKDTDDAIGAWATFDPEIALAQAAAMDDLRRNGRPVGALHGVPVGICDVFDSMAMPSPWVASHDAGGANGVDAAVVEKMREAGAVIIGKLATTALGYPGIGKTRNPHDADREAGGPSGAAAAAVAAGHVPLAIGALADGATVQAASYCGVVGFKPTRGMISRRGCPTLSGALDQIGVCGRTLEDVAALCDALVGFDALDSATYARPKPAMLSGCRAEVPVGPCFARLHPPSAGQFSTAVRGGLDELMDGLAGHVETAGAPVSLDDLSSAGVTVRGYEFRRYLSRSRSFAPDQLDPEGREAFERAGLIDEAAYDRARAVIDNAGKSFAAFFKDFDAIISASAVGEAPEHGVQSLGSVASDIWSHAGLSCISLPWLTGEQGLPIGVQLIGAAEEDDRLFRTAAWLERHMTERNEDATA
jgi:Asp-tRNA(Asn)/Glu-tRNA(Gln) amidotransferase A subunit family amidase